ncbi:sensor histidine kinase [Aureibacter tunicatorum]|uniref:Sensor histidine kinase YesM n=1 Tax=Aureibacter tunicatorum TaxID=866807 RepID=A0AAE3XRE9_9BACT|nr:sensor histidine kinase [Aureibacter tunicatorum]MDR6241295.1 sensor histidine kinase YesM [Aureibacter tunicatorum]BDD03555.1 hypothetical protein AUTU_10380 [Aureibacter tunicatorum]
MNTFGTTYAAIRSSGILIVLVVAFWINKKILLPQFILIENKKIGLYIICLIALLACAGTIDYFVDMFAFTQIENSVYEKLLEELEEWLKNPDFSFNEFHESFLDGIFLVSPAIFVLIFINLLYELQERDKKKDKQKRELAEQKMQTELKFLKSQINPHFLFNALSSLYTMSYMKMEGTTENIAKLSDMLRYLLYECNEEEVSLQKELDYLNSFIGFQLMKINHPENVKFTANIQTPDTKIEPMLLEPLVENAFKYSGIDKYDDAYINIEFTQTNKQLTFNIQNSLSKANTASNTNGGIGIENIQKRLELRYKNRYELSVDQSTNVYSLQLKITL